MRPRRRVAAAVLLFLPATAFAAFSMDWYSINGGGGVSTAPGISLAGSIGQASPGYSNGAGYSLTAGFWVAAPLVSDVIFRDGFQGATP